MKVYVPEFDLFDDDNGNAILVQKKQHVLAINSKTITDNCFQEKILNTILPNFLKKQLGLTDLDHEELYCISLSSQYIPNGIFKIIEGNRTKAEFDMSDIWIRLLLRHSNSYVLCHNHPGGTTEPSKTDRKLNKHLLHFGLGVGVNLVEHYIVCEHEYLLSIGGECYEW